MQAHLATPSSPNARPPSRLVRAPRVLGRSSPEPVLELARDGAKGPHAAGASRLPPLCLFTPVVYDGDRSVAVILKPLMVEAKLALTLPNLRRRVATTRAGVLLNMHRAAT